jgi:hypothetical protein
MEQSSDSFGSLKNDGFRFFFYELFLHFTATMISKERFKELGFLIHTPYVINVVRYNNIQELNFMGFKNYVAALNKHRNEKYKMNRISVTADTIKERATGDIKFDLLQQADSVLYYNSLISPIHTSHYRKIWLPETTCYRIHHLPIMKKSVSKRYFEKIKALFGVNSKEELVTKIDDVNKINGDRIDRWNYELPLINDGLNIDALCSIA